MSTTEKHIIRIHTDGACSGKPGSATSSGA